MFFLAFSFLPQRPSRCTIEATENGGAKNITLSIFPISIPNSNVLVQNTEIFDLLFVINNDITALDILKNQDEFINKLLEFYRNKNAI